MADHTPVPRLRGPSIKITSPLGASLWLARSGFRYFVTGHPIDGRLRDNASFLHDATMDYRRGPVAKYSRARWRRVARRNAAVGVPAGLLTMEGISTAAGILPNPPSWSEVPWDGLAQGYVCTLAGGLALWAVPTARRYYAMWAPMREYILPSTRVACQILGVPFRPHAAVRMLDLPPGWGEGQEDEGSVDQVMPRLYLPAVPLDKGTKDRLVRNVGARLGIPDATGEWSEVGGRAHVTFKALALPSASIPESAWRPALESSELVRPVLGFAKGNVPVTADYEQESPHIMISAPSGAGKSVLAKSLHTQRMRHGNGLIVLDFKRVSHTWAHGMPADRALYFYKIPDIHEALCMVESELTARMHGPVERLRTYRPVDILVEELNSLADMLRAYWTERRAEIKRHNRLALADDPYADVTEPPGQSPALRALGLLVKLGREVDMYLTVVGQRVSAQSLGANGGDTRESFQTRTLAKWTRKTWTMLADGIPYMACPSGPRGLWAIVQGGQATVVRVPFLSDVDARTIALSGPCPSAPILSATSGHIPVERVRVDRLADMRGRLVSLSEATDAVGLSLEALRVASKRADGFPEPAEVGGPGRPNRYDLAELVEWRERRDGVGLEVGPRAA